MLARRRHYCLCSCDALPTLLKYLAALRENIMSPTKKAQVALWAWQEKPQDGSTLESWVDKYLLECLLGDYPQKLLDGVASVYRGELPGLQWQGVYSSKGL